MRANTAKQQCLALWYPSPCLHVQYIEPKATGFLHHNSIFDVLITFSTMTSKNSLWCRKAMGFRHAKVGDVNRVNMTEHIMLGPSWVDSFERPELDFSRVLDRVDVVCFVLVMSARDMSPPNFSCPTSAN